MTRSFVISRSAVQVRAPAPKTIHKIRLRANSLAPRAFGVTPGSHEPTSLPTLNRFELLSVDCLSSALSGLCRRRETYTRCRRGSAGPTRLCRGERKWHSFPSTFRRGLRVNTRFGGESHY